jgi:L-seryl-tRNA(Ser) seleniumtransferase
VSAAGKASGVYARLGVRPVVNFQGTMTTIGASKIVPELHEAMAEASQEYVILAELREKISERLAILTGCEACLVTSGAAGSIALGTCGALTGTNMANVRKLPDLTGMKKEVIIQKAHRNGYDHAVQSTGVRIIDVENKEQFVNAISPETAMMYYLGGTSHDWEWETPVGLEDCLAIAHKAGFPVMVDAANMLPPWGNIRKLAEMGVDMICISGGKHMRGPQCSGILAGRKELIDAAVINSSPNADSHGRPMKVGREEMVGMWLACERYAKLDFDAIDRQCARQADYLQAHLAKILGLKVGRTPFDRTRQVHRVTVEWDEEALKLTAREVTQELRDGEPRIVVGRARRGVEFTVFMNEPGEEKVAVRRMREIFKA